MANVLSFERRVRVIASLVEGNSVRSVSRMTGVDKDAVMCLGKNIGLACANMHQHIVSSFSCEIVHRGILSASVGRTADVRKHFGDAHAIIAMDPRSMFVFSCVVGKGLASTIGSSTIEIKQISGHKPGRLVAPEAEVGRLMRRICSQTRIGTRRSLFKNVDSFKAALWLFLAHHNFVRLDNGSTPAIDAGIVESAWSIDTLVENSLMHIDRPVADRVHSKRACPKRDEPESPAMTSMPPEDEEDDSKETDDWIEPDPVWKNRLMSGGVSG